MNRLTVRPIIGLVILTTCALTLISGIANAAPPKRVTELVSTAAQNGGIIAAEISRDGNRVLYSAYGGTAESTFGNAGQTLANRTASGWENTSALPPRSFFGRTGNAYVLTASPSLDRFTVFARGSIGDSDPGQTFRYVPATGEFVPGTVFSTVNVDNMGDAAASDDQSYVYARLDDGMLYDMAAPSPTIVGLMPDNSPPTCGVYQSVTYLNARFSEHLASTDGNRVFFTSRGSSPGCGDPLRLYLRQGGASGSTTLISGPAVMGPDMDAQFIQAKPDGSQVFYTTMAQLDAADLNSTTDLYRYTVGSGNDCITCVVPEADVFTRLQPKPVLVAESGERAYFTSYRALDVGAVDGQPNLYVWRASEPGALTFITQAEPMEATGRNADATATSDGAVLVFASRRPELNARVGRSNGGFLQRYRYDDATGALDCMSCPPRGARRDLGRSIGITSLYELDRTSSLTADGRSFFFVSGEALVDEDVNEEGDVYEWRDGEVALVTDGRTPSAGLSLFGASADGRDVIFSAQVPRLANLPSTAAQLYSARVGGGFPSAPQPLECRGDQCQGRPDAASTLPLAGSVTFTGPGGDEGDDTGVADRRGSVAKVRLGGAAVSGTKVTIGVRAPAAGSITIGGARTTTTSRAVSRAGLYRVSVKLNSSARRTLRARGSVSARLRVTYRSSAGQRSSASMTVQVKAS